MLTEKIVKVIGNVGRHIHTVRLRQLFFVQFIGFHTVFLRDILRIAVVFFVKAVARVADISELGEVSAFLYGDIAPVCLIVDIILQMLRNLHGVKFLYVVPPPILVIFYLGVHVVAVKVFCQVDDILQAARVVAHFHSGAKLSVFVLVHIIEL